MGDRRRRRLLAHVPVPRSVERGLDSALDRALSVQLPVVRAHVARVRRAQGERATPAAVVRQLERSYVAAAAGIGAASGGAAALPGVGTATSLATSAAEIAGFVSASALFVLGVAEVHGVPLDDPAVRRALVLSVLLGDAGASAVADAERAGGGLGRAGGAKGSAVLGEKHWARVLASSSRADTVRALNSRLGSLLVARVGARQGALALGRALPFGLGAGVGAAGNAALGRGVIASARGAFGPAPAAFGPVVVDA